MARREFKTRGIPAEKPGGGMESLLHHNAEVCRSLVVLDVANGGATSSLCLLILFEDRAARATCAL